MYLKREMEKSYDFLIVGAGLAGCTFAYCASNMGKKCLVIDKRRTLGGNLYCEDIEGIKVHSYGAHIFRTNDKMVWDFVNQFSEFNNFVNSPIANYNGELYNLPFNMNTFHELWGVKTPEEARKMIDSQRVICKEPKNLEQWVLDKVGKDIYNKLIKDYTEKQWGRECKDLPVSIMRRIPIRYTFDNNYFNDEYQGIPKEGYNNIINKMLSKCHVITNIKYEQIKNDVNAKKVVYSGPLDELFNYRFGALEWRGLKFEHEVLDKENYQGVAVMNFTGKEPYTRIIEHKHFEFGKQKKTVITREYPDKWEIGKEPYYPINDVRNNELQERYLRMAYNNGYIVIGRLGEYRYFDMQDTIKSAIETAKTEVLKI